MKKLNAFLVSVLSAAALNAAVIEQVIVRQQWPWSTDVKVEYKISAVTNPVDITVEAYNGDTELPLPNAAITGERFGLTEDGVGTLVIDPIAAFGTAKIALANFKVKLTVSDSPENIGETIYRIFDLTDGSCENLARKDIMNHPELYGAYETDFSKIGPGFNTTLDDVFIWTGVTNNPIYKTTKLVMRKIPAASLNKVWVCGSVYGDAYSQSFSSRVEPVRYIKMTNDYYIGVFELTQKQCELFYGSNPSADTEKGQPDSDWRPVENLAYYSVIGNQRNQGCQRGSTGDPGRPDWPLNNYLYELGNNTVILKLQNKTRVEFYLPTQAQWEIACRAGTDTPFNSGKALTAENAYEVGWVQGGEATSSHAVGMKPANAWGLYDMHGNICEFVVSNDLCGDQPGHGETVDDPVIEPVGLLAVAGSGDRRRCGGSWGTAFGSYRESTSYANTYWQSWSNPNPELGLRVVCPVGKRWNGSDKWFGE